MSSNADYGLLYLRFDWMGAFGWQPVFLILKWNERGSLEKWDYIGYLDEAVEEVVGLIKPKKRTRKKKVLSNNGRGD